MAWWVLSWRCSFCCCCRSSSASASSRPSRCVSVHHVHYCLVGPALSMFFLLLLSFSKHIGFTAAFVVSGLACVGVITYYITHVLDNRAQGAGFGAALAVLYALLYAILSSE